MFSLGCLGHLICFCLGGGDILNYILFHLVLAIYQFFSVPNCVCIYRASPKQDQNLT